LFRNVQVPELLLILLIILLIFGARKLPDLARSLGASAKEFRKGVSDGSDEAEAQSTDMAASDTPTPEAAAPETPPADPKNPG
jgi:sec-independent protein translocase protein TatA